MKSKSSHSSMKTEQISENPKETENEDLPETSIAPSHPVEVHSDHSDTSQVCKIKS